MTGFNDGIEAAADEVLRWHKESNIHAPWIGGLAEAIRSLKRPETGEPVSFLRYCYLAFRESDGVCFDFSVGDGRAIVRLDGYAIVPLEEYRQNARNVARMAKELAALAAMGGES